MSKSNWRRRRNRKLGIVAAAGQHAPLQTRWNIHPGHLTSPPPSPIALPTAGGGRQLKIAFLEKEGGGALSRWKRGRWERVKVRFSTRGTQSDEDDGATWVFSGEGLPAADVLDLRLDHRAAPFSYPSEPCGSRLLAACARNSLTVIIFSAASRESTKTRAQIRTSSTGVGSIMRVGSYA